jgi:hypothetical protein
LLFLLTLVALDTRISRFGVTLAQVQLQFLILHLAFQVLHGPKVLLAPLVAVPGGLTSERLVASDAFPFFALGTFSTRPI